MTICAVYTNTAPGTVVSFMGVPYSAPASNLVTVRSSILVLVGNECRSPEVLWSHIRIPKTIQSVLEAVDAGVTKQYSAIFVYDYHARLPDYTPDLTIKT